MAVLMDSCSRFILPKAPRDFPSKGRRYNTCGMYTLKAVIEGFNGSQMNNYMYYADNIFNKLTGMMFPMALMKVMQEHGLSPSDFTCAGRSSAEKLHLLKEWVRQGPLILLIGHAYNAHKEFDLMRGLALQHYISLWGYDDEKEIFYVYDSNTKKQHYKKTLPIGNITLSYQALLRCWDIGGWGIYHNYGIFVDYHLGLLNLAEMREKSVNDIVKGAYRLV